MKSFLNKTPLQIIKLIVDHYEKDEGPDQRAKIVLSTNSGAMWTGVPIQYVESQQQNSISMIVKDTAFLSIAASEINGVFVESPLALQSFIEEPWKTEERFAAISRMQLIRELKTESEGFSLEFSFQPDSFSESSEVLYGASLAWVVKFKKIANKTMSEVPDAFKDIKKLRISHAREQFSIAKAADTLEVGLPFTAESFKKETIVKHLNAAL